MIGDRIRDTRKKRNMTQEELARAVYVTLQAVSQWERRRPFRAPTNLRK